VTSAVGRVALACAAKCAATVRRDRNNEQFAEDWWPYGISANYTTLETYLRYQYEQGLSSRSWKVEEVFAPELLDT
jgi:4,5-dihydroxyphthalate decarboxylase